MNIQLLAQEQLAETGGNGAILLWIALGLLLIACGAYLFKQKAEKDNTKNTVEKETIENETIADERKTK